MKITVDTHSHTIASGHAYSTLKEMISAGEKNGLEALAITEHAVTMPGTCGNFYFQNYKVIPRKAGNMEVLMGVELNILDEDGTVDMDIATLKKMDLTNASIHIPCYKNCDSKERNTKAYLHAMQNPYINIIGHPDDGRVPVDYEELAKEAKRTGTLLELNNSSLTPGGFRIHTMENAKEMLKYCEKYGAMISTGSDAHIEYDVGNFQYVKELLEICHFPEELVATTSFEKLKPYINRYKFLE